MEALFASCSAEFQNIRNAQSQAASAVAVVQAELFSHSQRLQNLDYSINQLLQNIGHRISALEHRLGGAQP
eukprot:8692245-Alexandrium_andersonii.AAC.1